MRAACTVGKKDAQGTVHYLQVREALRPAKKKKKQTAVAAVIAQPHTPVQVHARRNHSLQTQITGYDVWTKLAYWEEYFWGMWLVTCCRVHVPCTCIVFTRSRAPVALRSCLHTSTEEVARQHHEELLADEGGTPRDEEAQSRHFSEYLIPVIISAFGALLTCVRLCLRLRPSYAPSTRHGAQVATAR